MIAAERSLTLRIVHGNGHVKIHLNYNIVQSLLTICAYRSRFLEFEGEPIYVCTATSNDGGAYSFIR
jgi:hypothetical protein